MASQAASACRTTILLAVVLAALVLPSLACRKALARAPAPAPALAPAPAPALAPAPAPASVILCQDCDSRCQAASICDAYVAAAGCGNACSGATPDCEPCKSEVLRVCLPSCNEGCPRNCAECDCPSVCANACGDGAMRQCKEKCVYSFYAVDSCHKCWDRARARCTDACNSDCEANCVSG
ncbi:unnamed protein product [Triticum turgidum subsp. durum]|uniref:Uncharacterized protein n=1 Tax=Triticum turgidum subsp. durum TaxID=4567 RepID=A0A9R1B3T3_TRITD|nr:unnamed protein product [Triticum turgidum subsp. durum]